MRLSQLRLSGVAASVGILALTSSSRRLRIASSRLNSCSLLASVPGRKGLSGDLASLACLCRLACSSSFSSAANNPFEVNVGIRGSTR